MQSPQAPAPKPAAGNPQQQQQQNRKKSGGRPRSPHHHGKRGSRDRGGSGNDPDVKKSSAQPQQQQQQQQQGQGVRKTSPQQQGPAKEPLLETPASPNAAQIAHNHKAFLAQDHPRVPPRTRSTPPQNDSQPPVMAGRYFPAKTQHSNAHSAAHKARKNSGGSGGGHSPPQQHHQQQQPQQSQPHPQQTQQPTVRHPQGPGPAASPGQQQPPHHELHQPQHQGGGHRSQQQRRSSGSYRNGHHRPAGNRMGPSHHTPGPQVHPQIYAQSVVPPHMGARQGQPMYATYGGVNLPPANAPHVQQSQQQHILPSHQQHFRPPPMSFASGPAGQYPPIDHRPYYVNQASSFHHSHHQSAHAVAAAGPRAAGHGQPVPRLQTYSSGIPAGTSPYPQQQQPQKPQQGAPFQTGHHSGPRLFHPQGSLMAGGAVGPDGSDPSRGGFGGVPGPHHRPSAHAIPVAQQGFPGHQAPQLGAGQLPPDVHPLEHGASAALAPRPPEKKTSWAIVDQSGKLVDIPKEAGKPRAPPTPDPEQQAQQKDTTAATSAATAGAAAGTGKEPSPASTPAKPKTSVNADRLMAFVIQSVSGAEEAKKEPPSKPESPVSEEKLTSTANLHAKRVTTMPEDIQLARRIHGERALSSPAEETSQASSDQPEALPKPTEKETQAEPEKEKTTEKDKDKDVRPSTVVPAAEKEAAAEPIAPPPKREPEPIRKKPPVDFSKPISPPSLGGSGKSLVMSRRPTDVDPDKVQDYKEQQRKNEEAYKAELAAKEQQRRERMEINRKELLEKESELEVAAAKIRTGDKGLHPKAAADPSLFRYSLDYLWELRPKFSELPSGWKSTNDELLQRPEITRHILESLPSLAEWERLRAREADSASFTPYRPGRGSRDRGGAGGGFGSRRDYSRGGSGASPGFFGPERSRGGGGFSSGGGGGGFQRSSRVTQSPPAFQRGLHTNRFTATSGRRYDQGGGGGRRSFDRDRGGRVDPPIPGVSSAPLPRTKNRWRPGMGRDDEFSKLRLRMNGLLNKLTLEKYGTLLEQLEDLLGEAIRVKSREDPEDMDANVNVLIETLTDLVLDKAVNQAHFSGMYASLAEDLRTFFSRKYDTSLSFRSVMRDRVVARFEEDMKWNKTRPDPSDLPDGSDERELVLKRREQMTNNIIFIGELLKVGIVSIKKLTAIGQTLVGDLTIEDLVADACRLTQVVGGYLAGLIASATQQQREKTDSESKEMKQIGQAKVFMFMIMERLKMVVDQKILPSRIRFMCLDVFDLRDNNWRPRQKRETAKTLKEINADHRKESSFVRKQSSRTDNQSSSSFGGLRDMRRLRGGSQDVRGQIGGGGRALTRTSTAAAAGTTSRRFGAGTQNRYSLLRKDASSNSSMKRSSRDATPPRSTSLKPPGSPTGLRRGGLIVGGRLRSRASGTQAAASTTVQASAAKGSSRSRGGGMGNLPQSTNPYANLHQDEEEIEEDELEEEVDLDEGDEEGDEEEDEEARREKELMELRDSLKPGVKIALEEFAETQDWINLEEDLKRWKGQHTEIVYVMFLVLGESSAAKYDLFLDAVSLFLETALEKRAFQVREIETGLRNIAENMGDISCDAPRAPQLYARLLARLALGLRDAPEEDHEQLDLNFLRDPEVFPHTNFGFRSILHFIRHLLEYLEEEVAEILNEDKQANPEPPVIGLRRILNQLGLDPRLYFPGNPRVSLRSTLERQAPALLPVFPAEIHATAIWTKLAGAGGEGMIQQIQDLVPEAERPDELAWALSLSRVVFAWILDTLRRNQQPSAAQLTDSIPELLKSVRPLLRQHLHSAIPEIQSAALLEIWGLLNSGATRSRQVAEELIIHVRKSVFPDNRAMVDLLELLTVSRGPHAKDLVAGLQKRAREW